MQTRTGSCLMLRLVTTNNLITLTANTKLFIKMETSLIGKAVDFGSKEYGFEPHVSNYPNQPLYILS